VRLLCRGVGSRGDVMRDDVRFAGPERFFLVEPFLFCWLMLVDSKGIVVDPTHQLLGHFLTFYQSARRPDSQLGRHLQLAHTRRQPAQNEARPGRGLHPRRDVVRNDHPYFPSPFTPLRNVLMCVFANVTSPLNLTASIAHYRAPPDHDYHAASTLATSDFCPTVV
jgi:hypothetical protein